MLGSGLGVLGLHDDAIGEKIASALDLGELAAAQPGEQRQADQGAEGAEAAGRLPHGADFVIGERATAIARGFEPLGA